MQNKDKKMEYCVHLNILGDITWGSLWHYVGMNTFKYLKWCRLSCAQDYKFDNKQNLVLWS